MKEGDRLIQQMKLDIAKEAKQLWLRVLLNKWSQHSVSIAYVTVFATEGLTTKDMTGDYQYGLAKLYIGKECFERLQN